MIFEEPGYTMAHMDKARDTQRSLVQTGKGTKAFVQFGGIRTITMEQCGKG